MINLNFFRCRKFQKERKRRRATAGATKYDAHHKVLSQTYGAFADLRRELSDSKTTVTEREEILRSFATCPDSQRAWLLLEDYFEKLSLSRKDFPDRLVAENAERDRQRAVGRTRVFFFAREAFRAAGIAAAREPRPLCQAEEAEQEKSSCKELENWLSPPAPLLETPRATLARRLQAAAG
jgi:hypothetical protein